jgi:predicted DNA-binding transcriptional regulator YafY
MMTSQSLQNRPSEATTFLRRIEILQRLPAKGSGQVTATVLLHQLEAAGYAVNKRTVERDLQFLQDYGLWFGAVVCDARSKPYGWSIERSSARRAHQGLSVNEALSFAWVAREGAKLLPQGMLDSLAPFFRESEARLQHDWRAQRWFAQKVRVISGRPIAAPKPIPIEVMRAVSTALFEDQQLQLHYSNAQGHRSQMTLSPLALVVRDLGLYLVAWIPKYANLRVLHLSRIVSAKVLPDKAEAPAGFDIDAYVEQGDFQLGGELAKVRLRFDAFAGHVFLESPIAADQEVLQVSDAGEVELSATMRLSPQFVAWLLGFGDRVEVMAPEGLREEVGQRLREAWERYAK